MKIPKTLYRDFRRYHSANQQRKAIQCQHRPKGRRNADYLLSVIFTTAGSQSNTHLTGALMDLPEVTRAVAIELNAIDLLELHVSILAHYELFTMKMKSAIMDPQIFDLARRLESAMFQTGDLEHKMIQVMIEGRARVEAENLEKIARNPPA
jgi:hypothetical protein